MSEENYVKSEANNCTEIIVPLYIEFVTNLWHLRTRRRIGKHPVDCLPIYLILLINIVTYLVVINA